jgi:hypothetical protein
LSNNLLLANNEHHRYRKLNRLQLRSVGHNLLLVRLAALQVFKGQLGNQHSRDRYLKPKHNRCNNPMAHQVLVAL